LICPSVWPLLHCSVIAFLTASISLRNVRGSRYSDIAGSGGVRDY